MRLRDELRGRASAGNSLPRVDPHGITKANCFAFGADDNLAKYGHEIGGRDRGEEDGDRGVAHEINHATQPSLWGHVGERQDHNQSPGRFANVTAKGVE